MLASEDAWECEELYATRPSRRTVPLSPLRPAQITPDDLAEFHPPVFMAPGGDPGPLSLQKLCVSMVALSLDQYLMQLGPLGLDWLPLEAKVVLLTIAR